MRKATKSDLARKKHGCLTKIATSSKASIGAWIASNFYDRVSSVENQEVSKGSTLLSSDEVGALATLEMSKDFMTFMRDSHDHLSINALEDFS